MDICSKQVLLNCTQMQQADRIAIADGIAESTLIARAGAAAANAIAKVYNARCLQCAIVVICGKGHNGADGYIAAFHLAQQGLPLRIIAARASQDCTVENHRAAMRARTLISDDVWCIGLERANLPANAVYVDALFGTGFKGIFDATAQAFARRYNATPGLKIALDLPSGVNADSGEVPTAEDDRASQRYALRADITYTFFRRKIGQLLFPARAWCGELHCLDIGIPKTVLPQIRPRVWCNHPALWQAQLPQLHAQMHKYHRGALLIDAGRRYHGAAVLAAHSAQACGTGLVHVLSGETQLGKIAARLDPACLLTSDAYQDIDFSRYQAVLMGSGNGMDTDHRQVILHWLTTRMAGVLDADALNVFADCPQQLFNALHERIILTPHEGEFRRLFAALPLTLDKLTRCRRAASMANCLVVLKGPDTVIADPQGDAVINDNAPPTLATAGSGDVLGGLMAGLLARSMPPFAAACAAVWLHGQSGRQLSGNDSASALPRYLAQVLREQL